MSLPLFSILSKQEEICGHYIVEASAGTGKTFSIAHLVIRLIVEKQLPLHKILLVTFTRAATRELKKRIELFLIDLQTKPIEELHAQFPYLKFPLADDEKLLLLRAHHSIHSPSIFTIHSFALHAIRNVIEYRFLFPNETEVSSGAFPQFSLASLPYLRLPYGSQVEKRLIPTEKEEIVELIDRIRGQKESPARHGSEIVLDIKSLLLRHKQILLSQFPLSASSYKGLFGRTELKKEFAVQQELLETYLLETRDELFEKWLSSAFEDGCALSLFQHSLRKVRETGYSPALEEIATTLTPLLEELFSKERFEQILKKELVSIWRGYVGNTPISPDEYVDMAVDIARTGEMKTLLRGEYEAVIIDEFQDTDPRQWDLFRTLYLEQDPVKTFVLVGDPKQSIYGFRGASLAVYADASRSLSSPSFKTLSTNYRSSYELIDALNVLFSRPWNAPVEFSQQASAVYRNVLPSKEKSKEQKPPLVFWKIAEKISKDQAHKAIETAAIRSLYDLLENKKATAESITILVRTKKQGLHWEKLLRSHGFPASFHEEVPLAQTSVYTLFSAIQEALESPFERSILYKILAHPLFDLSLSEIEIELEKVAEFFQQIGTKTDLATRFGAITKYEIHNRSIIEWIRKADEESAFFALTTHWLSGKSLKEIGLFNASGFTTHFHRRSKESISIMTVHKSKGLEFKTVFFLGHKEHTRTNHRTDWDEELRLLYVAMTRAKEGLYSALCEQCTPALHQLFSGISLDKISGFTQNILIESVDSIEDRPFFAAYQKEFFFEDVAKWWEDKKPISFSQIVQKSTKKVVGIEERAEPAGPLFGLHFHQSVEKILQERRKGSSDQQIDQIVTDVMRFCDERDRDYMKELLKSALYTPFLGKDAKYAITQLESDQLFCEIEFIQNAGDQQIVGVIDLVASVENKFYIIDWKTNFLPDYEEKTLLAECREKQYTLQAQLYKNALRGQLLQLGIDWSSFGGVMYVFVRGLKEGKGVLWME